jgi:hypothetical protein
MRDRGESAKRRRGEGAKGRRGDGAMGRWASGVQGWWGEAPERPKQVRKGQGLSCRRDVLRRSARRAVFRGVACARGPRRGFNASS